MVAWKRFVLENKKDSFDEEVPVLYRTRRFTVVFMKDPPPLSPTMSQIISLNIQKSRSFSLLPTHIKSVEIVGRI